MLSNLKCSSWKTKRASLMARFSCKYHAHRANCKVNLPGRQKTAWQTNVFTRPVHLRWKYLTGYNTLMPFMREDGLHWRKALNQSDWVHNTGSPQTLLQPPISQGPGAAIPFVWTARLWCLPLPAMPQVMERKMENPHQPRPAACSVGCTVQAHGIWWTGAAKGLLFSINTPEIPAGSISVLLFY